MANMTFKVTGMTCDHCARSAEEALNGLPGVSASVSYATGHADVTAERDTTVEQLVRAIEGVGWGAKVLVYVAGSRNANRWADLQLSSGSVMLR